MNINRLEIALFEHFDKYKKRYKNPVVVALKLVYYILSNLCKFRDKTKPSNTWYKAGNAFDENDKLSLNLEKGWNIPNVVLKSNEHLYFSIDRALKIKPELKAVWLVFFMGIGDYFNASAFIEQLRKTYPNLEFNAFVSKNADVNNNPLVYEILKTNPNISRLEYFDGHRNEYNWENYDYSDCYDRIKDDEIIIPMVYEYASNITCRYKTLCETFTLEMPAIVNSPVIYPITVSETLQSFFNDIKTSFIENNARSVVFMQLSSRASKLGFTDNSEYIRQFLNDGYLVISVEKSSIQHPLYFEIDKSKLNINDTIQLLKMLNEEFETYCVTINSCFWAISAGLNIKNLGLQVYRNPRMYSEYFPNIYVVTSEFLPGISGSMQFVAKNSEYIVDNSGGLIMYQYKSEFIYACFKYVKERAVTNE